MHISRPGIGVVAAAVVTGMTVVPAFAATSNTVTVQPGDSMWSIAQSYGISTQSLESANPAVNPMDLLVGTRLTMPGQSASNSSNTSSNLYWMEHVINAEAGGQSLQAQIAVGDVVLHRMEASGYGSTVQDVVFQQSNGHYQFTSVANGYIYSTPNASSMQAATDVLVNHQDVVPGAMVFYNPAQTPSGSWVWSQPRITQIDNLVFAK